MKADTLKMALVIAEMLIGLIFVGLGLFFLFELTACRPGAYLCLLAIVPVLLMLAPGCVMLAAGVISYFGNKLTLRKAQKVLVIFLIVYFVSLLLLYVVIAS